MIRMILVLIVKIGQSFGMIKNQETKRQESLPFYFMSFFKNEVVFLIDADIDW